METNENDKPVALNPHLKTLRMKLDLLYRRKRLLILHYSGNVNSISLKMLAAQLTKSNEENGIPVAVTEKALRRDYERRAFWEPLVWATYENEDADPKEALKFLGLARMKAIALMDSADNDSAKVGAIGKLANVVEKEITLKQSLGLLPRVNMETIKVDNNVTIQQQFYIRETTELLRNYECLFKGRTQKSDFRLDNPQEQVDEASSSDN